MTHPIYRVRSFKIEGPYTLRVQFDDGAEQVIDFQSVLAGELFGPLRDLAVFNQVAIDPEVHTLVWPNGADFDPATLHDWPEHCGGARRSRQPMGLQPDISQRVIATDAVVSPLAGLGGRAHNSNHRASPWADMPDAFGVVYGPPLSLHRGFP